MFVKTKCVWQGSICKIVNFCVGCELINSLYADSKVEIDPDSIATRARLRSQNAADHQPDCVVELACIVAMCSNKCEQE
jgi:hypothetical protein